MFRSASSALALALTIAACSDKIERPVTVVEDAGSTEAPATDAGDQTPDEADAGACALPASFGSTACNTCVATTCCGVLAVCDEDPGCRALRDCVLACLVEPDAFRCGQSCRASHPDPDKRWENVETCWTFDEPCRRECL